MTVREVSLKMGVLGKIGKLYSGHSKDSLIETYSYVDWCGHFLPSHLLRSTLKNGVFAKIKKLYLGHSKRLTILSLCQLKAIFHLHLSWATNASTLFYSHGRIFVLGGTKHASSLALYKVLTHKVTHRGELTVGVSEGMVGTRIFPGVL